MASNPLTLLGLVAVWEHRGDAWQKKPSEENLYDKIMEEAFPSR